MPSLTPDGCVMRCGRLASFLAAKRLDAAAVTDSRDIYYFTGVLFPPDLPALLLVTADAEAMLVAPERQEPGDLTSRVEYEWNHRGTRHPDSLSRMLDAAALPFRSLNCQRFGIQRNSVLLEARETLAGLCNAHLVPIDESISDMQRRKDADEVAVIRESIRANLGAYAAAQAAIRPGVTELEVLAAGCRGAMLTAGEKVIHDGDYQCGQYNGPARNRPIEAGELYIIDAWTCYRGYWSDMSRTFAVGVDPTDEQQRLYDHIRRVLGEALNLLRPGVDGREVYLELDRMIREHPTLASKGLIHHGGHAIGLRAHELPDINLERGGQLEPGNIICIEPGGYFPEARFGVRLENMYLITEQGAEELCPVVPKLPTCK
ncbi:MAG: Xaa-Pro peptidase family protein [Pirellulales bacterium]